MRKKTIFRVTSEYIGSHTELVGEGDIEFFIALPKNFPGGEEVVKNLNLRHGCYGRSWEDIHKLPPVALIATDKNGEEDNFLARDEFITEWGIPPLNPTGKP